MEKIIRGVIMAVKQAVEDEFWSVVSPFCFQTNTILSGTNGGSHPDILSEEYTPLLNQPQPVLDSHVVVQEETTLNFSSTSHSCSAHTELSAILSVTSTRRKEPPFLDQCKQPYQLAIFAALWKKFYLEPSIILW